VDAVCPFSSSRGTRELDAVLFGPRMATISLGVLGLMGGMLAITGIFGMAAYSVSKRLRELGIRMALGAKRKELLQAALGRAVKLLAIGSAAGLLLGILASRVLAFIVYQATPRDPLVLAGRSSGHGVAGNAGHVDSGAARAKRRSFDTAPRGLVVKLQLSLITRASSNGRASGI
jgi:ABC-type antimicrobial peptide transport system permease subunit